MPEPHRKHTPITSEKQRGLFGAEYARRKEGEKGRMPGITQKELRGHLKESKGKKLPKKAKVKRAARGIVVDPAGVGPREAATTARPPGPPQEVRTTRETILGRKQ